MSSTVGAALYPRCAINARGSEELAEISVCANGKRRVAIVGAGTKKNFPSHEKLRSSKRHFSNSQLYAG
jgi:hypothetical protein